MRKIVQFPTDDVLARRALEKYLVENFSHVSPDERKSFMEDVWRVRERYRLSDLTITFSGLTPEQGEGVRSVIQKDMIPPIRRLLDEATAEIIMLMSEKLPGKYPGPG